MGSTVTARCECGFLAEDLPIGGGMHSHEYLCSFPCYCKNCHQFTISNLLESSRWSIKKTPLCRWCQSKDVIPYDDKELQKRKGKVVVDWNLSSDRQLVLTDGEYYCPTCKQFDLTFEKGSRVWD